MIGHLHALARPLLHALDPEDAHRLAVRMLQVMLQVMPLRRAGATIRSSACGHSD